MPAECPFQTPSPSSQTPLFINPALSTWCLPLGVRTLHLGSAHPTRLLKSALPASLSSLTLATLWKYFLMSHLFPFQSLLHLLQSQPDVQGVMGIDCSANHACLGTLWKERQAVGGSTAVCKSVSLSRREGLSGEHHDQEICPSHSLPCTQTL